VFGPHELRCRVWVKGTVLLVPVLPRSYGTVGVVIW
jgi:hypothetical protein